MRIRVILIVTSLYPRLDLSKVIDLALSFKANMLKAVTENFTIK